MERTRLPPIPLLHPSEVPVVDAIVAEARPKHLTTRIVGVITAPTATFADVVSKPRALGVLVFIIAVCAVSLGTFMSTDVGRSAALDQQMRTMEGFGIHPTAAQYERLKEQDDRPPYLLVGAQAAVLLVSGVFVAGLATAVFNLIGGNGSFRQTFAVVPHSGVIIALGQLFMMPLNYARESLSNPATLAAFFPFLEENSFGARLLGSIDLFVVWWIVTLSIGLGVLYRRRTASIAMTLLIVYVVLGVVIAGVKTALSGA